MIRLLRQNKHQEEPEKVRAWAVNNGWLPEAADELVKIWEEVYELSKKPKVKDGVKAIKPEQGSLFPPLSLTKRTSQRSGLTPRVSKKGPHALPILFP